MDYRAAASKRRAEEYLNGFGVPLLSYVEGSGTERARVLFPCPCGKVAERKSSSLKKHPLLCSDCLLSKSGEAKRISPETVQTLLDTEGALLVRLYVGDANMTRVVYRCKCGTEVDRKWASLQNPTLRTKPKCPACSLAEKPSKAGQLNHMWDPNKPYGRREREWHYADTLWQRAIFERDDFTCQITGVRGVPISSHHIWSKVKAPDLRLSLLNGITLAREVHRKFHTGSRVHNFTAQELVAFALAEYGKQLELPPSILTYST